MERVLRILSETWFLILAFVGLIIWYANVNYRLANVEASVLQQQALPDRISALQTDVAVIKANVEFIKQQVR